ncbi:MAG: hypothetical protein OH363_05850 [Candidatus Parvarchaeota archaeon]|nr:hypothetical protein [Candidatus Jingweiarchaeum tengchongense]
MKSLQGEFLERAEIELEKAQKIIKKIEFSPGDVVQNCVLALMDSINFICSAILGRLSTVDEDYLILIDRHEKEISELIRLYFYLKNVANKKYNKVERSVIRVDGWKSSFYLKKSDLEEYLEKVREHINKIKFK